MKSAAEAEEVDHLFRFLAGDTAAFDFLYVRWTPIIHASVARCLAGRVSRRVDVMDATQFVWLRICEGNYRILRRFDENFGSGSLHGYLAKVGRTKAVDWLRRQPRDGPGAVDERSGDSLIVNEERTLLARRTLHDLNAYLREKLSTKGYSRFLSMMAGRSASEEAERTGDSKAGIDTTRRDIRRLGRAWRKAKKEEVDDEAAPR